MHKRENWRKFNLELEIWRKSADEITYLEVVKFHLCVRKFLCRVFVKAEL